MISRKFAYILTVNDEGRRVLDGPYIPGRGKNIEDVTDSLDRHYEVIYLPTSSHSRAVSMLRSKDSSKEGVDKASKKRYSHKLDVNAKLSSDRGGL